jgi:hypothetical protein
MEASRPTYITHTEPYIEYDNYKKYKFLFTIVEVDDVWFLTSSIFNVNEIHKIKTIRKEFSNRRNCLMFLGRAISRLKKFTPKILTFDQKYEADFLEKTLEEWLK